MGRTPSPTDPPHGTEMAELWLGFLECSCLFQSIIRVSAPSQNPERWDANWSSWLCLPIAPVSRLLHFLGGRGAGGTAASPRCPQDAAVCCASAPGAGH